MGVGDRPLDVGKAFIENDEVRLTAWMRAKLQIAVWEKAADCESLLAVEQAAILALRPPLNVKDNDPRLAARISTARKKMVDKLRITKEST